MEYVVKVFKVLKNLVHTEANARAQKTEYFVAFLTKTRFLCFPYQNTISLHDDELILCMRGFLISLANIFQV